MAEPDSADDGLAYTVSQVLLDFSPQLPVHPPARLLLSLKVELGRSGTGFVQPRHGVEAVTTTIAGISALQPHVLHGSAITQVGARIVEHFAQWGYSGIVVLPHTDDIDSNGVDQRVEGQTALRLVVQTDGTWAGVPSTPDEILTAKPFKVSQFVVEFDPYVPRRPPVAEVMRYSVDLAEVPDGYVGPRPGRMVVRMLLGDAPRVEKNHYYPSAILTICKRLEDHLADRGFDDPALECVPHPEEIDADGNDVRIANQTALRLVVRIAPERPDEPSVPAVDEAPAVEPPSLLVEPTEADGQFYPVSQVILEYDLAHPEHPSLRPLMDRVYVDLAETAEGYVAASDGAAATAVHLVDLPLLEQNAFSGSAILQMSQRVVDDFHTQGFTGINVRPHPEDIDETARDVRPEGITVLRMVVRIGVVTELRTIASGSRVPQGDRMNNPKHQRLAQRSPVQPSASDDPEQKNLMNKEVLDNYISWLNRHPGRRVDAAVSPGSEAGGVALDLLVTEERPWLAYVQGSNTGTQQTEEWRYRFGFSHHQLTGNDDILSLDYITGGFDATHAVVATYEAPLFDLERTRVRVNGFWSQYSATDVGFAGEVFTGKEWYAGADLIQNVFQDKELFIDVYVGVQWQHDETTNAILAQEGRADFFLPRVGAKLERDTKESSTVAFAEFEINLPGVADTKDTEMIFLGRDLLGPSGDLGAVATDFKRLKFDARQSFYLEPILWADKYNDPTTPQSSTLAHEAYFAIRGQWSPDRLVPQFERTVGGLYSVRGYPESVTAGDTVLIANAEYRLHVPRLFGLEPDPRTLFGKPFRHAPQYVYGRPDWDLIFRGFFDYGKVYNTDRRSFETDFDLMGAGGGVELLYRRNVNVRMDWGMALEPLDGRVTSGSQQIHIVATLLY